MARALAVVLVLLLVAGCGAKWKDFESAEGKFSAQFPGKPRLESQKQASAVGQLTLNFYSVDRKQGLYGVGYVDFPTSLIDRARADPDLLKSMLDNAVDSMIKGKGLKLDVPTREISLRNSPGREVQASGRIQNKDAFLKARVYLVENRLYQLMAVGEKNALKQDDIDLFFYSFRLL